MSAVAAQQQQQQQQQAQGDGGIPIESLPIAELGRIKKTLDQEQTNLIKNYEQLKLAMGRFVRSQKAISDLKQTVVGTETLIPLTQSMYVPAKTTSNDKLPCISIITLTYNRPEFSELIKNSFLLISL